MEGDRIGWLERWRLGRIAKRYARALPRRLKRYYGPSRYYTRDQIDVALRRSRLDRRYAAMPYLLLLQPEAFKDLPAIRGALPSERVQAIFIKHFRNRKHARGADGPSAPGTALGVVAASGVEPGFWSGGGGDSGGDGGGGDGGAAF